MGCLTSTRSNGILPNTEARTKQQFANQICAHFVTNQKLGRMKISNSYILQRLYQLYKNAQKTELVQLIKSGQKTKDIECVIRNSFKLVDIQSQGYITESKFVNFMYQSYKCLFQMALKQTQTKDRQIIVSLRWWANINDVQLRQQIKLIFKSHLRPNFDKWQIKQYKQWVISGLHWTFDIQIEPDRFSTPLNLFSLFGFKLQEIKPHLTK